MLSSRVYIYMSMAYTPRGEELGTKALTYSSLTIGGVTTPPPQSLS